MSTVELRPKPDLRTLIDSIPAIAWVGAPDGSLEFWNQRWHDYTGGCEESLAAVIYPGTPTDLQLPGANGGKRPEFGP